MRNKMKWLVVVLCLVIFASMAIGSGSSSSTEKKDVVKNDGEAVTESSNSSDSVAGTESKEDGSVAVTIEEQVLVDQVCDKRG